MQGSGVEKITVLGGGVLGGQIAWQSAFTGKQVTVYDLSEASLEACKVAHQTYAAIYPEEVGANEDQLEAARGRLSFTTGLAEAVAQADLVIEAVPEVPAVKTALYQEMAPLLLEHTLVATNTSTLLPSQFAEDTGRPDKYCAMHFANLIWKMNLCEIMGHDRVNPQTLTRATQVAIEIGMVPIPIRREQNAYVINSFLLAILRTALTLVTEGVASVEDVDRTYMIMHRGVAAGPFGIIDIVGMNTVYNILTHWGEELDDPLMKAVAGQLKADFIDRGHLGLASGRGYYEYPDPAYQSPDFLAVPDIGDAAAIAALARF